MRDNLAKDLTKRVTFKGESNTPDGMGGWISGLQTVATVYAEVSPIKAEEAGYGGGEAEFVTHRITVRYNPSLFDSTLQATLGDRVFDIRGVRNPKEANRYLEFYAQEVNV